MNKKKTTTTKKLLAQIVSIENFRGYIIQDNMRGNFEDVLKWFR